jgi:hypothetical protein
MTTNTLTKEEFTQKMREVEEQLKTLPPEKKLEMLKEVNAYLRGLNSDLAELDTLIKEENQIEELKRKVTASYRE